MFLSLNWLREHVNLPKSLTSEKISEALTMHTVEVERIENQSEKFNRVIVGKILEISQHPNADRLRLAKVDIGSEKLNIVCGAPNIEIGQLVPVATIGTILPNGVEIKEAEVRGEKSCGMLCAPDELGLGDDHSGIMVLDKKAKVGQAFSDYLNLKDTILEVDNKSLSNRPDLWGHIGIARELSAIFETKLTKEAKRITIADLTKIKIEENKKIDIKIENTALCPRYIGLALDNIKIEDSPKWLQDRLIAVGVRPINNIVDITNYVMFELGQPMHAFDASKVDEIIVRLARKDEVITTLDGVERKLPEETLVIADSKNPIAIAGVMGGENSEVDNNTVKIILESANFDHTSIRKTSGRLSLRTESSMRYEKGLDPNLCETGMARAIELIQKICPTARIVSVVSDQNNFKLNTGPIKLNLNWIFDIIGKEIEPKKIMNILHSLGFATEKKDKSLLVTIPTWRATKDISIQEDVVEEILRIYGFNNIESKMPIAVIAAPKLNGEKIIERKIRNILSQGAAMTEIYNYSFVGEDQLKKIGIDFDNYIKLANPLSSAQSLLRQSLAPNLMTNIKINQAKYDTIKIFELGSIYMNLDGNLKKDSSGKEAIPYQEKSLGLLCAGSDGQDIFYEIKGIIDCLAQSFNLVAVFRPTSSIPNWADSRYSSAVEINGQDLGLICKIDEEIARKNGIKKKAVIAEINLNKFFEIVNRSSVKLYKPMEKFPPLVRDLAFVVNQEMLYNDIRSEIVNFNENIKDVQLFDVYEGDKIGANNKSLAFRVIYQADRTLTSEEVDVWQKELIKKMEDRFEAKIRDF